MNYLIRKSKYDDIHQVMDAHQRSIRELCIKDYNQEQVDKWSDLKYTEEVWERSINNECHLVVEVDGKIEGFCHAKVHDSGIGEIAGLYFSKVIEGRGIGREVFDQAIDYIKEKGSKKVIITGTITAKGFYERMGFKEVEKQKHNIRGALVTCFRMEMLLD